MKDSNRAFVFFFFKILTPFLLLITYTGCGNNPPEIMQTYWQLNLQELSGGGSGFQESSALDGDSFEERLSLFVLSVDEDGNDEIESIFLIQDDEELFWELKEESWEEIPSGGDIWRGASGLTMPPGEAFPRKTYRLLVIDKSGQRSEKIMAVSVKKVSDTPVFPYLVREGEGWRIESPYAQHTLRLYDGTDVLLGEIKIEEMQFSNRFLTSKLKPEGEGNYLIISSQDQSNGWTLVSLPIYF